MRETAELIKCLVSIESELFRFEKTYNRLLTKLEPKDINKYLSQFNWFKKSVTKALQQSGLACVDLTNQEYDAGMALTPLNLEDFESDDKLYIQEMIQPIIMLDENVIQAGTAILGRLNP